VAPIKAPRLRSSSLCLLRLLATVPFMAQGSGGLTKDGQATGKRKVEWGLPHRGRISPEEAAYVREHLDEVQKLRSERACRCLTRPTPGPRSGTACNTWRPDYAWDVVWEDCFRGSSPE
jgi:hypothetical protein